jgi:hypothetical protein
LQAAFYLLRLVCLFDLVLFLTPVPGVTGVGHSGFYSETGQNELLQNDPEDQKSDYEQYVFHSITSGHSVITYLGKYIQFFGLAGNLYCEKGSEKSLADTLRVCYKCKL